MMRLGSGKSRADARGHWETIYGTRPLDAVSWFSHLEVSLALIERANADCSASIIDAGGGSSTLVDDLIARGYGNVTILDVSPTALALAKKRLGKLAASVHWICEDITEAAVPRQSYDVWHDRAVFHFLTGAEQRKAYVKNVTSALRVGGHLIVGTFSPEGPRQCSGLDVIRYDPESLHREFGQRFRLIESVHEAHETPSGTIQPFIYCLFQLKPQ
jgi:SAM-dependent methyltransferase